MKNLRYSYLTAWEKGVNSHAEKSMRNLGITYAKAVPQSLSDSWWFLDCQNIPDPLPPYLTALELSEAELQHWTGARIEEERPMSDELMELLWQRLDHAARFSARDAVGAFAEAVSDLLYALHGSKMDGPRDDAERLLLDLSRVATAALNKEHWSGRSDDE